MMNRISIGLALLLSLSFNSAAFGARKTASASCVASCEDIGKGAAPLLEEEFNTFSGREIYAGLCRGNPKGKDLFPGDSGQSLHNRLVSYCDFNPAFRLCFVCERKKNNKVNLSHSLDACKELLNKKEIENFKEKVLLEQKQAPQEPDPANDPLEKEAT